MDFMTWLRTEWDRAAGWALIVLGAVALLLGALGVGDSPFVARQLNYLITGGIGGLFLLGAGAVLVFSADLHDEWRKLDRIDAALEEQNTLLRQGAPGTVPLLAAERTVSVR